MPETPQISTRGAYEAAPPWARQAVLDVWVPDPEQSEAVLQGQLDRLAARAHPMHDPAYAALDDHGRWLHFCARRDAARRAT